MNEVKRIQVWYRKERELSNYSIMDIEINLKHLGEKGMLWVLKDIKDICEAEEFLIEKYLNVYRANQIYDNLDDLQLQPSNQKSKTNATNIKEGKHKKQEQHLEIKDVRRYTCYKKAKELEEKVYEVCNGFPAYEKKHMVDQLERSASSIRENIELAEQKFIRVKYNFYSISIGSAKETTAWLQMSLGQRYISQDQFDELDSLVEQVVRIQTKTLFNIREKKGESMGLPSPYTPDVKKFRAYQDALLLVERIYEITRKREFWTEKHLMFKMRDYATSTAANIAEAHQLYIKRKFSFFNNALEALNGLESLLQTSLNKRIISEETIADIEKLMGSIRKVLLKTLANISKNKAS